MDTSSLTREAEASQACVARNENRMAGAGRSSAPCRAVGFLLSICLALTNGLTAQPKPGQKLFLISSAPGEFPLSYPWSKNGVELPGEDEPLRCRVLPVWLLRTRSIG